MATFEQKGHLKFKDAAGNLHVLSLDPSAHASTHSKGGTDPISAESIGAVSQIKNINPDTTGFATLLDYMASLYARDTVVVGNVSGFPDLPDGGSGGHAYICTVGGILTVILNARTVTWIRGTNSLTSWTSNWRKVYDEGNPPTAEDVGAVPKDRAIHINPGDTIPLDGVNVLTLHAGVYRIAGHNLIGIPSEHSKYGSLSIFRYGGYNWGFALLVDSVNDREWIADGNWESSLVWREIRTSTNPGYTYGTADLTAGSSPLENGKLYFVYE